MTNAPGSILTVPSVLKQFKLMPISLHYTVDGFLDIVCLIFRMSLLSIHMHHKPWTPRRSKFSSKCFSQWGDTPSLRSGGTSLSLCDHLKLKHPNAWVKKLASRSYKIEFESLPHFILFDLPISLQRLTDIHAALAQLLRQGVIDIILEMERF